MLGPDRATPEFTGLYALFVQTRKVFYNYWERGELPREESHYLATVTLAHIDDIDLGFKWVLRSDDVPMEELPYVLRPADTTDWRNEPKGAATQPVEPDLRKVMALRHAQVVFGYLPATPKRHVSYPGYASYSDIKVPRTPLELRERIEELAIGVWDAASGRALDSLDSERSRRVYGFFEAGSWLTTYHLRRMRRN